MKEKDVLEVRSLVAGRRESIHILHLSDLHFNHQTMLADQETVGFDAQRRERFLDLLLERIAYSKEKGRFDRYDLIFVTGDLADNSDRTLDDRSHRAVLGAAKTFLFSLCAQEKIDPEVGLLVIPGNHDYRWKGNVFSKKARKSFGDTFSQQFQNCVFDFDGFRLLVACFDSNHVRYKADRASFASGIVDIPSMLKLVKAVGELPKAQQPSLRVALVHHHPLPVAKGENLDPRSWLDRWLGKQIEGAPEYMLLRNSGSFLHNLLENNYRLVLHGHLHQRGYWRALKDNEGRWLEVISGGAAGTVEQNQSYSFNSVRIDRDGFIEAIHYGVDQEGRAEMPVVVPTAPYELCRERQWDISPRHPYELRSDLYSKTWDVIYPQGDLVSSEVYLGLRSAEGRPCDSFSMASYGDGLAQSHFTAGVLTPKTEMTYSRVTPPPVASAGTGERVSASQAPSFKVIPELFKNPSEKSGPPRVEYRLKIKPPLEDDRRVDVIAKRHTRGVLFRSVEDQMRFGVTASSLDWDEVGQMVVRPCERMLIRVRFHQVLSDRWFPENLVLVVIDADGNPASREEDCGLVTWDYWSPQRLNRLGNTAPPEAILSVYRPRLGYIYCLRWKLEARDEVPAGKAPTEVPQRRAALLRRTETGGNLRTADEFARNALDEFWRTVEVFGPPHREPDVHAYLYAFDDAANVLVCRGTTSTVHDPMVQAQFRYGRDTVGTAFRLRESVGFDRNSYLDGSELIKSLPEKVAYLFAFPLNWPTDTGPALGVLALATTNASSDLGHMVTTPDRGKRLTTALCGFWGREGAKIDC